MSEKDDLYEFLWDIPESADYAVDTTDLDWEDISEERLEKTLSLLEHEDPGIQFDAARILASWGMKQGVEKLKVLYDFGELEGWASHRLHAYDDTKRQVLSALTSYWASQADLGQGEQAMKDIYPLTCCLLKDAGHEYFELGTFLDFVSDFRWNEYREPLKDYFQMLMARPENQYYKLQEVIVYLYPREQEFVETILHKYGKTYQDFLSKEVYHDKNSFLSGQRCLRRFFKFCTLPFFRR